ncbi:MAG: glycosyltransferase [Candidatus Aminicenantes bacterium]|nr:glycosyltransferase [Candidatus Aminicenantes bacterium]
MTVLVIPNYFDRDGVTSKILTEAKALAGLDVRLIIVVPRNPLAKADITARLQALGLQYIFALTHFRTLYFFFPFSLIKLGRIIRKEQVDLLHVHARKALVMGVVLNWLHKIPLVFTIHGTSRRELPLAFKSFWFRSVARVIAVSEECAAFFQARVSYPAHRLLIGRNGIDFLHFRDSLRERNGYLNLLYVSRLDRDKRLAVDAVMAAVAGIFPRRPQIRLRILGDGRQYGKIKKKARAINAAAGRDIIAVEGWADDLAGPIANADVILGVGRCVLEAIACGRPVLVVGNEKIGGLVTKENFPSLQKANFSGRGATLPICSENLMPELEKVSSGVVFDKRIRALALAGHDAAKLARQIKEIYLELTEG